MTLRRSFWIALGLLAGLQAAPPAVARDAREILLNSLEPRVTVFIGEQVTVTTCGKTGRAKEKQRQRVYRKGNRLRINYEDGKVLFDDGSDMLLYLPRQNVVERSPSGMAPERMQRRRRFLASDLVTVEHLSDDTVARRSAHVLSVRFPNGYVRKVWIDKQTYLQLRMDETRKDDEQISTYFTRIRLNAEPPAAMLSYTPPSGAKVVRRGFGRPLAPEQAAEISRRWGGLYGLKQPPAGYEFRGYFLHEVNNEQGIVSLYVNSEKRSALTLFQGPTGGDPPSGDPPRRLKILSTTRGRARLTLVGSLPDDEMQRVLDSAALP